jgi:hypothetical protein
VPPPTHTITFRTTSASLHTVTPFVAARPSQCLPQRCVSACLSEVSTSTHPPHLYTTTARCAAPSHSCSVCQMRVREQASYSRTRQKNTSTHEHIKSATQHPHTAAHGHRERVGSGYSNEVKAWPQVTTTATALPRATTAQRVFTLTSPQTRNARATEQRVSDFGCTMNILIDPPGVGDYSLAKLRKKKKCSRCVGLI